MSSRTDYNNPRRDGSFCFPYHYELLSDRSRVEAFERVITSSCSERVVLESGTGSGIMSVLALHAGARRVFAVERDPSIAAVAKENFARLGKGRALLIEKSILDTSLDDLQGEKVEVVIAENLSTWQVTEPEIEIMNHINSALARGDAVRIPAAIQNRVELAESRFTFLGGVKVKTYFFEFSGIPSPRVLSDSKLFQRVDLGQQNEASISGTVRLTATEEGLLNSLRLTSPVEVGPGVLFESSDSLMPPVIVPLREEISISRGDTIEVSIGYTSASCWEEVQLEAAVYR